MKNINTYRLSDVYSRFTTTASPKLIGWGENLKLFHHGTTSTRRSCILWGLGWSSCNSSRDTCHQQFTRISEDSVSMAQNYLFWLNHRFDGIAGTQNWMIGNKTDWRMGNLAAKNWRFLDHFSDPKKFITSTDRFRRTLRYVFVSQPTRIQPPHKKNNTSYLPMSHHLWIFCLVDLKANPSFHVFIHWNWSNQCHRMKNSEPCVPFYIDCYRLSPESKYVVSQRFVWKYFENTPYCSWKKFG